VATAQFKQADLQRIMRAAEKGGLAVEIDLKTMMVSIESVENGYGRRSLENNIGIPAIRRYRR
jgi:hypothetical protein